MDQINSYQIRRVMAPGLQTQPSDNFKTRSVFFTKTAPIKTQTAINSQTSAL